MPENDEREPARAAALAGTSFPIDPRHDCEGALRPPDAQLPRCGPTVISLSKRWPPQQSQRRICRASRGDRHLVLGAVPVRELSDEFTTGSSIMPQKRNPDAGGAGPPPSRDAILGALVALLW